MTYHNFEGMPLVLEVADIADTLAIGRNKAYELFNSGAIQEFLEESVTVYGLKKWGNSFYSMNLDLITYIGERYVRSVTTRNIDAYYTMLLDPPAVVVSGHPWQRVSRLGFGCGSVKRPSL